LVLKLKNQKTDTIEQGYGEGHIKQVINVIGMAFNHNMVHNNIVRFPNAIDGSVGPTNVNVNVNGTLGIMQI
jgi:hypothetical protein